MKTKIKNYFLVLYLRRKFELKNRQIAKNLAWTKRKCLTRMVKEHCNALMQVLLSDTQEFSFREKKFIVDRILNHSFDKGLDYLKANAKAKEVKPILHVNSFIIYETFIKGVKENRTKKSIKYSINKELGLVQEQITKSKSAESVLEEKISA